LHAISDITEGKMNTEIQPEQTVEEELGPEHSGEVAIQASDDFLRGIRKVIRDYEEDLNDDTLLG
jgi:hypothetical protein